MNRKLTLGILISGIALLGIFIWSTYNPYGNDVVTNWPVSGTRGPHGKPVAVSDLDAATRTCASKSKRSSTWTRSDHHQCLAAEANKFRPANQAICDAAKGDMHEGRCILLIL